VEDKAVEIVNPKTLEYKISRASLLPGLLKAVHKNRQAGLPLKILEVKDIVIQNIAMKCASQNERRLAAVYCDKSAGFKIIHGLLDRILAMLTIHPSSSENKIG
jgi:phenylalanyl-tRNA synthetase beta chain